VRRHSGNVGDKIALDIDVAHRGARIERVEAPEQAIVFRVDSRREIKCPRASATVAVAKSNGPEAWLDERKTVGVVQSRQPFAAGRIKSVDFTVLKIGNENIAGKRPKSGGRHRHAPRRVEGSSLGEPLEKVAAGVKYVHIPIPRPANVIMLLGILKGEGDEKPPTDVFNAERRIPGWKTEV